MRAEIIWHIKRIKNDSNYFFPEESISYVNIFNLGGGSGAKNW